MATVKTDVILSDSLYQQASALANEMQISPGELFAIAMSDYLHRHQDQKLVQSINDAYADGLDTSEQTMLEGMRCHQSYLVEQDDLSR